MERHEESGPPTACYGPPLLWHQSDFIGVWDKMSPWSSEMTNYGGVTSSNYGRVTSSNVQKKQSCRRLTCKLQLQKALPIFSELEDMPFSK